MRMTFLLPAGSVTKGEPLNVRDLDGSLILGIVVGTRRTPAGLEATIELPTTPTCLEATPDQVSI